MEHYTKVGTADPVVTHSDPPQNAPQPGINENIF